MEATELLLHETHSLCLSFGSSAPGGVDFGSKPGTQPTVDNPIGQEEDENDDYVPDLTRQMANYMLQDVDKRVKSWGCSGSPQSTLWSPFGLCSGSPIGSSREPSPPLIPESENIEKMKVKDELNSIPIPFSSKQALINYQIRSARANFWNIKEEDRGKEKREQRNRRRGTSTGYGGNYRPVGSGMKAVFLEGSGSGPGSGGTGVFLPRTTGTVMESRKRAGCPRVIIPARVVEALKHHFDKMGVPSKFTSDFPPHHDALLVTMNNNNNNNGLLRVRGGHCQPQADLPPEWTY